jgi:NDP-sugar pyrophosphorylase family protein
MNVIIPMAGNNLFTSEDFFYPKPLIDVRGLPLIQYVVDSLASLGEGNNYIFVVNDKDCKEFNLDSVLKLLVPDCKIVSLKNNTKGAVCSILMAIDLIDKTQETIVVNADQIIEHDLSLVVEEFRAVNAMGGVLLFNSIHPRWSFVDIDSSNEIHRTAEKKPISRNAIAGFYYFRSFVVFQRAAFKALENNDLTKGQLFISALLNQMILKNEKITGYRIKTEEYKSFYSPQKLKEFEIYLEKKNK